MFFAILTLLTALALATVAGWFAIAGFMTIYAAAPIYALIMGVVIEVAKLVTASWLYRNWEYASWKLKIPLLYFTLALMTATSIGVFGFLSRAHIEQGIGKIDNSAKIESIQHQIDRENAIIADNERVIAQLDATVNSFLERDRTDRALAVRRAQARQREELRRDTAEIHRRINELRAEKFKYESEIRKLQVEVGPIRYIAEMIYGVEENYTRNIESAVRIFTLLLVSTLDPLAVILLVAANHTLLRLRREKEEKENKRSSPDICAGNKKGKTDQESGKKDLSVAEFYKNFKNRIPDRQKGDSPNATAAVPDKVFQETISNVDEGKTEISQELAIPENDNKDLEIIAGDLNETKSYASEVDKDAGKDTALEKFLFSEKLPSLPVIHSPKATRVEKKTTVTPANDADNERVIDDSTVKTEKVEPWAQQEIVLRELLGDNYPHFKPQKINKDDVTLVKDSKASFHAPRHNSKDKYLNTLSWLTEFRGPKNETRS